MLLLDHGRGCVANEALKANVVESATVHTSWDTQRSVYKTSQQPRRLQTRVLQGSRVVSGASEVRKVCLKQRVL